MDNAQRFLDGYKRLEEELIRRYDYDEKYGSPVVRFMNDKEGRQFRDKLDLCREIRNFLSHHSELEGTPVVQPSDAIISFLEEVREFVCRPPLALPYATQFCDILKTSLNQRVQPLMKKMQKLGFSHVPVLDSGTFIGVFSIATFFGYALKNGLSAMNDDMLIEDFRELLPPDKHENEQFLFMHEEATLFEVRAAFEKKTQRSKRLAAIFLTDNGSINGRMMGMLTPWDVIGGAVTGAPDR